MSKLTFNAADVRRIIEHTIAAPDQMNIAYTDKKPAAPAVLLVHDHGVYLMSNGVPSDRLEGAKKKESCYIAYAEGCNPDTQDFDDWWETSRELVGGDDFVETLPWAKEMLTYLDRGAKAIVINFTANRITMGATYPKKVSV